MGQYAKHVECGWFALDGGNGARECEALTRHRSAVGNDDTQHPHRIRFSSCVPFPFSNQQNPLVEEKTCIPNLNGGFGADSHLDSFDGIPSWRRFAQCLWYLPRFSHRNGTLHLGADCADVRGNDLRLCIGLFLQFLRHHSCHLLSSITDSKLFRYAFHGIPNNRI